MTDCKISKNNNIINIISIDVGIKNLACCLIEVNNALKTYDIKKWEILNLCNHTNVKNTCFAIDCKRDVVYKSYNDKYFCNIHAKKCEFVLPKPGDEYNMTYVKKLNMMMLESYCKKQNIEIDKDKMDFSKSRKKYYFEVIDEYLKKNCLEKIKQTNASKISLIDIGRNIVLQLDEFKENKIIDIVLIENQIGPLAIRMKSIQGMITQYFVMRQVYNIDFINSSNKLKLFQKTGEKTSYKQRKQLGIRTTFDLIKQLTYCYLDENNGINEKNVYMLDLFNNHKKKDDLADCFLQCYWYMNENKLLSN